MEGVDEGTSDPLPESGVAGVAEEWSQEKSGRQGLRLIPEEFGLHYGRIGGATELAAGAVIQKEATWASNTFMRYVKANMEDPVWVSEVLGGGGVRSAAGARNKVRRWEAGSSKRASRGKEVNNNNTTTETRLLGGSVD